MAFILSAEHREPTGECLRHSQAGAKSVVSSKALKLGLFFLTKAI